MDSIVSRLRENPSPERTRDDYTRPPKPFVGDSTTKPLRENMPGRGGKPGGRETYVPPSTSAPTEAPTTTKPVADQYDNVPTIVDSTDRTEGVSRGDQQDRAGGTPDAGAAAAEATAQTGGDTGAADTGGVDYFGGDNEAGYNSWLDQNVTAVRAQIDAGEAADVWVGMSDDQIRAALDQQARRAEVWPGGTPPWVFDESSGDQEFVAGDAGTEDAPPPESIVRGPNDGNYNAPAPPGGPAGNSMQAWAQNQPAAPPAGQPAAGQPAVQPPAVQPPGQVVGPTQTLGAAPGQGGQNPLTQTTLAGPDWQGNRPEFLGEAPASMPGPTQYNIARENLVEGRMASLMDNDNPVFQSLRESITRASAARGGQNSLMASQAATVAMSNMAFQIGSQDAQLLARSAEFNASMANQFGLAQQQFMFNALASDQNYRQALTITREQIAGAIQQANISASAQLGVARIGADTSITLAEMKIANDVDLLERGQANTLEVLGVQFGQQVFRDNLAADLTLRNETSVQATGADLDLRNAYILNEQTYGQKLGVLEYGAQLDEWMADNDFQREWALNWQQNSFDIASQISGGIFNMGLQPGMTTGAINARVTDVVAMFTQLGFLNNGVYVNGTDPNSNYAVFPPSGSGPGG